MNVEICYTDQELLNLLYETIDSIEAFKIGLFFVLLKEELPNKSTSENLQSFRFKMPLSMFGMLFMRINLSSKERGQRKR